MNTIKGQRARHRFHKKKKKNPQQVLREPRKDIQPAPITHAPFYPDTFHEKFKQSLACTNGSRRPRNATTGAGAYLRRRKRGRAERQRGQAARKVTLMCLITLKQPLCWNALTLPHSLTPPTSLSTFYIKLLSDRKAQEASLSAPSDVIGFSGPLSDPAGCELPLALSDVSTERISDVLTFPICSMARPSLCSSLCTSCQP